MSKVHVLHYHYDDKSGYGIEAVYEEEKDANAACDLLAKHATDKNWYVDSYEVK
jgi:hypothetical protein